MQKELRSGITNFWLVVDGLSQFLAVERFLASGGSWWHVVARGGLFMIKIFREGGQGWCHLQTLSPLRTTFAFTHPLF